MTYKFKYRRKYLWRTLTVNGHRYDPTLDKMILYFADGSIEEVSVWSDCDTRLGPDWVLAAKKAMEEKAGQSIPVKADHA